MTETRSERKEKRQNSKWKTAMLWYLSGSLTLILLMWTWIFGINGSKMPLEYGATLTVAQSRASARLLGWQAYEGGYDFQLQVEDPAIEYAILVFGGSGHMEVRCGSQLLSVQDGAYNLPVGQSNYWLKVTSDLVPTVYMAERGIVHTLLQRQIIGSWSVTLVMVVMTLYTLSLYLFKSSESYLWDLYFYQMIVLIWALARFMPASWQDMTLWVLFCRYFIWIIVVANLKYSVNMVSGFMPSWVNRMMSWPKVLLWAGTLSVLSSYVNGLRLLLNVVFQLLCVGVLSYAVARRVRGASWLLVGMISRVALFPMVLFSSLPSVASMECLGSYLMRRVPLADIPFVLGGMFFVNQKFAHQFSESERLAKHLDELVAVRTKELEVAHAERQSMILNITHDLRTPLFVIKNCLGVVEENPRALPDMLPILQQRSEFVSSLTEDLFLLVKLQEGKLMLNQQRENLSEVLAELGTMTAMQIGEKQIRFTQTLLPETYVWGDRVRLQQIFQNLITNAFHYTPEGGEISVRMEIVPKDREPSAAVSDFPGGAGGDWGKDQLSADTVPSAYVRVLIRDSGKGISPADTEHIFERYFYTKADNKHDSSGLGLSIAKELTVLHHGTIDFASREGEGTQFCVTLPLC